ncbi:SRPBCC family protein [Spirulina subsalsa FACHB-351]|uniref:SRPBCC family protein n=1 Tax=Spirulina subsalsa FACHB-351 TaxID=234711 RepID=A0ABT3L1G8_9CYAN|nr:SRPBCC family protein [Spirulina subsalsa]MCW6035345.1 SRPBCC family protein [Spirulina subsalsa FACHB-351]
MLHFEQSSLIKAPIEQVWQFHEQPDILHQLTPPWQPVQIIRRQGGLEVGAISEFRLWLGFVPITWVARHTQCDPPHSFVDEQILGPMQSWTHHHQFTPEGKHTRLTDRIDYELPGGLLAEWLLGGWVNSRLREMFRYRHDVTQQALKHHS